MDHARLQRYADQVWMDSILPELTEYVRIPNKSPNFDPDWAKHGYMDAAMALAVKWCRAHAVAGMQLEVVQLPGRTPLLFIEVPATPGVSRTDTVLLYGHLDKQPEFTGWEAGLDPWIPVLRGDKLYGRGGADDGYAVFSSLTAIKALQDQGLPHARCVLVIECCEESGSYDLPHYIDHLAPRLGEVSLVVCLDAECGNYEQLWVTTSLRGNLVGTLTVRVLDEGVHSGMASGLVASSFRIVRHLLDRVEDAETGAILTQALHAAIPEQRLGQARRTAEVLKDSFYTKLPFFGSTGPLTKDVYELVLNNTWRPTLSITGAEGLPELGSAGNVLRPYTTLKLSFRLPPTGDAARCAKAIKDALEQDPPYGAHVSFDATSSMGGWSSPTVADWLHGSLMKGSQRWFAADAMYMGTGGSIPFMGMLGERFPAAQFMVTGVLGPKSNAHGPNEFLHIPTARRLTACVAQVITDHQAS
jgi:acetylornithine deacetylase/succinyl-diaminopimelate desuccinylase-like protein